MYQATWLAKQSLYCLTYVAWVTKKHIPKIINHRDITFEICTYLMNFLNLIVANQIIRIEINHIYIVMYPGTCFSVVDIDVSSPVFAPGKKNYERIKQCLLGSSICCDFLVSWSPQGTTLYQYFSLLLVKCFSEWFRICHKFL